jgi:ClpP class serine protease
MTGFMTAVHGLDRRKGLDLILHTPGGQINATKALVNYLRYAFKGDIRALVLHQAMSAGTIIALACKSVCAPARGQPFKIALLTARG